MKHRTWNAERRIPSADAPPRRDDCRSSLVASSPRSLSRFCPRLALLLFALLPQIASAAEQAVLDAQARRAEVMEQAAPTVVAIFGPTGGGGGSGVLISADGYALSNFHVTSAAGNFMKCGLNDGELYDAVIVGIDPTGDVALLKLLGRDDFPFAELGDSDELRVGDWVFAMGNPFLLATDFSPTVTYGIVSGVNRYQYPAGTILEYADCIQTDASINPGNSGGPLFNEQGQVVGINGRGSFEKRGRVNVGAGYAISINQIKHFMGHLRSGRIVDHATLGATVSSRLDGAVVVDGILERSEAYRRGLRVGDEVVSFAGRPIRSVNQFKNVLGIYPKGWKLPLVYRRDGRRHEILVRLRGVHRASELAGRPRTPQAPPDQPDRPRRRPSDPERPDEPRPEDGPRPDGPSPPRPGQPGQAPPPPPDEYKHMFVQRPGFANHYFNALEQERVLRGLEPLGDFAPMAGPWTLGGETDGGDPFELLLSDRVAELSLGPAAFAQDLSDDAEFEDLPPESGGLLTALHHLRLLLTRGPRPFTEFYYLGTEPLDGSGELVDVLVSVLTGVETRWYFDPENGTFLGFDTRLAEDADECEVRFTEFRDFEGRRLPATFQVRHAARDQAAYKLETVSLSSSTNDESP